MIRKSLTIIFVALIASVFIAIDLSAQQFKFKKQDKDKATKECQDGSPCKPEFVPTKDDKGNVNLALLEDAKPNADCLLAGWCPARHCTEYLNDGFYNNCRSWISCKGAAVETWAEIDLGDVYLVKYVVFGSDHCGNYKDRSATNFKILVATQYNADSNAGTWEKVFDYKGDMINQTTTFEFKKEVEARYVRIVVFNSNSGEVRIDEIEIYGGALAVHPEGKLVTCWGQIKMQY